MPARMLLAAGCLLSLILTSGVEGFSLSPSLYLPRDPLPPSHRPHRAALATTMDARGRSCDPLAAPADRRQALFAALLLTAGARPASAAQIESQGAGGAGLKTLSQTGVRYSGRMGDDKTTPGSFIEELLGSDDTPAIVTFNYPESWKLSTRKISCQNLEECSSGDISARDLKSGISTFVVVAPAPPGGLAGVDSGFFMQYVYGKGGKYGAYGAPDQVDIEKQKASGLATLFDVKFTAFTPNLRMLDKRSVIAVSAVGQDIYMLVTTTTVNRWKFDEKDVRRVSESFAAAAAPKRSR